MRNLALDFDQLLPSWLAKTQLQWVQWVYALWQLLRCNPITLLVLSVLPFYLRQWRNNKTVLVVGVHKDFDGAGRKHYLARGNIEIIPDPRIDSYNWQRVKYDGYYYITHGCTLDELARILESYGTNIIFVERVMTISGSLSVGKEISQTEAYEKIFTKRYHCSKGTKYVIPTCFDYVELSSKFWGILSTIPILLQAKNYVKFSNLLSLVIILCDINRHWLYKLYDNLFERVTKFVKLNIFKEKTSLYDFFSIFSNRWNYHDLIKKHAYVAQVREPVNLVYYCKLESSEDLEILFWVPENRGLKRGDRDEKIFMEIVKDRANCELRLNYKYAYPVAKLGRPVYVV